MKSLKSSFTTDQISNYLNTEEIVRDTVQQIMKDFDVFSLEIHFSGHIATAYQELHSQLVAHIEHLMHHSNSKLISVLYRIDLSEEQIRKGCLSLPNYNFIEALAHLIIERELKKVLSRRYYK